MFHVTKPQITVTVDPDVKREARARPEFNVSGFVNRALRSYLFGQAETAEDAELRERLRLAEERAETHREVATEAEAEVERIQAKLERREDTKTDQDQLWRQARDALRHPSKGYSHLEVGNPAVETHAEKLGITQTKLLRQLRNGGPTEEAVTDGGRQS